MWGIFVKLLNSVLRGSLKQVLTGAGVMLASYGLSMTAFNSAVTVLHSGIGGIPANIMTFVSMAGLDNGISIILGAVATRLTLNQGKLFLKKV